MIKRHQTQLFFEYCVSLEVEYASSKALIEHLCQDENTSSVQINGIDREIKIEFFNRDRKLILKSISFKKSFNSVLSEEDESIFLKEVEKDLAEYLRRIQFTYSPFPQDVRYRLKVIDPNGRKQYVLSSTTEIGNAFCKCVGQFNESVYRKLWVFRHKKNLAKYIESYLLIKSLPDLQLQLIAAYGLYEIINHDHESLNSAIGGKKSSKNNERKVLKIDESFKFIRDFASHGVIDREKTVKELGKIFNSANKEYKFDRNNREHIQILQETFDKLMNVIQEYLNSELALFS